MADTFHNDKCSRAESEATLMMVASHKPLDAICHTAEASRARALESDRSLGPVLASYAASVTHSGARGKWQLTLPGRVASELSSLAGN